MSRFESHSRHLQRSQARYGENAGADRDLDPASALAPHSRSVPFQTMAVPYVERCQLGTVKTTEILSDAWSIGEVWALVDTITDDVLRRHGSRIASEIAEVSSELAGKWGIHGVSRPRVAAFLLIIKRDPIARAMFKQFFDGE